MRSPIVKMGLEGHWLMIQELRIDPCLKGPDGQAFRKGTVFFLLLPAASTEIDSLSNDCPIQVRNLKS